MVDAVGGVTILNPTSFQWALGAEDHAAGVWAGTFPAGEISLDGYDALQYSRVRYTSVPAESSDFARSARQQRLLSAVRSRIEINPAGLQRGLALLDALEGGRFHTDLSVIDLMLLAPHLQTDDRVELAEGEILEATTNSAGQYVLVVIGRSAADDLSPLRAFIAARIDEAVP
jgi:anionic cell wall polymer biosynthesis LytR-Cps2A-Psr (LCP) family protein